MYEGDSETAILSVPAKQSRQPNIHTGRNTISA